MTPPHSAQKQDVVSRMYMFVRLTRGVWLHLHSSCGVREEIEGVPRGALLLEGVPLEINTVDVHLGA